MKWLEGILEFILGSLEDAFCIFEGIDIFDMMLNEYSLTVIS